MARDSQTKLSKKDSNMKRSKRVEELNKKKKKDESSDSDHNEESGSESEEMDVHEYRKFLSKIFPSKNLNKKIKAGEKLKESLEEEDLFETEEDEEENEKTKGKNTKGKNKKQFYKTNRRRPKTKVESESEDEDEDIWITASEDEEEEEDEDEEESVKHKKSKKENKSQNKKQKKQNKNTQEDSETEDSETEDEEEDEYDEIIEVGSKKGSNKLNIIFTIGGAQDDEDYDDEDYDEDEDSDYVDSDSESENEDESVSTDESDNDDDSEDEEEEEKYKSAKKTKSDSKSDSKSNKTKAENIQKSKCENDKMAKEESSKTTNNNMNDEMLSKFKQLLEENPNDKALKKCMEVYENDLKKQKAKKEKKVKKQKAKNMRIFRKNVRDKNMMNDYSFYEKLEIEEQKKIIKELRETNKITRIEKPYRMTLLESEIPTIFKAAAMKKINSLRYMEAGSGEFYKIKNWVDTFMRVPFNKYESLPITIEDGVEKCHDFMENAKSILDSAVYGLNDAKMQIMQMLGQLVTNPKAIGTAIAINGPPGTGKTSLVKEGISKILNRPFAFIALGGATDSSFLEGHSYTYEGSTWGKIVQILIDSKCMNPVIYFDELDKISDTPRGEEITGILTHLTDTSQNSQFHDKYFAEINFDLSKCLFIFSYNDESKVNPILKDRMYRIQTKGYNLKQKTVISNNYLLPKIQEQVKFNNSEIIIPDETINHIIEKHCNKEDGVRNLKRCLEIIYTKLNLYRLMKPGSNLFEEDMSLKVEFPFTVTKDIVDKLIKTNTEPFSAWHTMFV